MSKNPKAVEKWMKEEYPAIKKRAKSENAEIHWGDVCETSTPLVFCLGFYLP